MGSYTESNFRPTSRKIGVTNASNTGSTVVLIDPNPNNEIVPLEDLFIYAELKARISPKSLLVKNQDHTFVLTNTKGKTISVGTPQGGDGNVISESQLFGNNLTTSWTEIGGIKSNVSTGFDYEGFGITNIDIQIKSQVAPTVVIDFVDVRAATLFEQGSCSPYGFFFQLPYPVFELTVKGYYGKAATYYLNLVKFNAKFNADTGNMECRAEFVGYSFAFLSDILIGYVYAAGFLDSLSRRYNFDDTLRNVYGSEAASFCNAPTNGGTRCLVISDLLKSLNTFDKVQKQKIIDSPEYFKLVQLKNLVNKYSEYRESINKLLEQIGDDLKQTTQATNPDVKGQKLKVLYGNDNKIVKKQISLGGILATHFNTQNGIFLNFIKNIMTIDVAGSYPYQLVPAVECLLKTTNQFQNQNNTNNTIFPLYDNTKITSKAWFGPSNFWGIEQNIPPGSQAITYGFTSSDTGSDYFIDFGFILENINEEIKNLEIEVKKETDSVTATIDNLIESTLGFRPSIRNVFKIILANTEAFMEVLKKVTIDAERYHSTENLNNFTSGNNDANVENTKSLKSNGQNKVFSWPTYSVKENSTTNPGEYEKYPGEETSFKSWPEVIFVEDFLKAYLKAKEFDDLLNANFEGKPGYDNFSPINPLESPAWNPTSPNKYKDAVGTDAVFKIIGERLFIALDHSLFQPIRLTEDALKIGVGGDEYNPKIAGIGIGKWNPIKETSSNKIIPITAELDSWNLLNSSNDLKLLQGLLSGINDANGFIEKVKTSLGSNLITNLTGINIKRPGVVGNDSHGFKTDADYYSYMSDKDKGISIKKNESDQDIWVHPNPFKMDTENLIKIIPVEEQNNIRKINLTNDDFKKFLNETYNTNLAASINNINLKTTAFNPKITFSEIDESQQLISFQKQQLYTSLAMCFDGSGESDTWWTNKAEVTTQTESSKGGDIVSNMGMITYWDDSDQNDVFGVRIYPADGDIKELPQDASNTNKLTLNRRNLYWPLISTPMWLDNVIDFRKKIVSEVKATENYTPDTQFKNLAYLFLHTLKCTPFVQRIINDDGFFCYLDDGKLEPVSLNNTNDATGPSLIWSHLAFNTIGGIAKVPKAWLLTLGAQLWRWREFTGSEKGKKWRKTLSCIDCFTPQIPIGNDPLIQPGYNSFFSMTLANNSVTFARNPTGFRLNPAVYLPGIYGGTYGQTYNNKIPNSVFHPNTEKEKNSAFEINTKKDYIFFNYINAYKGKLGGINKYAEQYTSSVDNFTEIYSWPQVYIAPHHIPYVSTDKFNDGDNGEGANFVFVTDSWIGYQDYQTIMPTTTSNGDYNESDGENNVGYTHRSKEEDGNLGMIIQYIPDEIKDKIVDIFEGWSLGDWKENLIKIVDPVNFGGQNDTLLTSYSYRTGENSPMNIIKNSPGDDKDNYILSLNPNESLKKLLTDQYWILNSTPKIWYGIGDDKIDPDNSFSQPHDEGRNNKFYENGFVVPKTQFDEYLTSFYNLYNQNLQSRIKELENQNKDESDTGDPLKDNDLKLSIYRSFKSLSEKWLQRNQDELFFNLGVSDKNPNCNKNFYGDGKLASHFKYVNRVWGDIGNESVIDISKMNEIKDNKKMSLYQLIGNILTDNEFMFFPLPTYIDLAASNSEKSDSEIAKMFQPILDLDDASCGPLFVCMYVGGVSRKLDLQIGSTNCKVDNVELSEIMNNVNNDSYNLSDVNLPPDIASGSFTAFKILYGQQNQNHFKNIQLDQSEFTETAESLNVIDKLAQNQGSDRTTKGQSLMPAYLTRSYTCSVEMMGNMMIQPMTYFDLQGVPMFSGAYIITEVSHNVKPNNISTSFKGVRQPRTIVPIIKSVSSAMNLTLSEKGTGKGANLSTVGANENTRRNKARNGGLNWKDQINTNVEPKIKSTDKDDQIMKVIRNFVEGGYYHPVHWYINDKGAKRGFNLYKRSGETMFGEDRAAGKTESTADGAAYWAYIDTKSGYGDYGTLPPTKPNISANASNNYSRNHRTAEKVGDDGPWNEAILQELSLRTNVWKFNEGIRGTPSNTDPKLIELSNKMSKTQLDSFFRNNFLNLDVSKPEIRKALKTKIESDGRLLFAWYRARFNGPGFFRNYAERLIKVYSENTNITNDDLLIKDLDNRWEYAQGLNAGSAQLIEKDVLKIAEIVGVKPKNNSIKPS